MASDPFAVVGLYNPGHPGWCFCMYFNNAIRGQVFYMVELSRCLVQVEWTYYRAACNYWPGTLLVLFTTLENCSILWRLDFEHV